MKKMYMMPAVKDLENEMEVDLMTVSSDNGIGYGGVDDDGSKDPAARRTDTNWDD